jgi:16S rRNA processing protein RimM
LLLLKVRGCDDRTQAEAFSGVDIAIRSVQRKSLAEGEYYWSDLIGLRVVNLEGLHYGVVDHLIETGANDVLVVKPTADSLDQRERLIPYLPDQVLKKIDLVDRVIQVDWDADF